MIAIITRTSNRPNYFNRCRKSVKQQGKIISSHNVITDNPNDIKYLKDPNIFIHSVNAASLKQQYNEPAPRTATPPLLSIHNLYFKIKKLYIF